MDYLTWLGGRGVIKTWTEVAARVRLYRLTFDLTSLVPSKFSHQLQVRKVGTAYFFCVTLFKGVACISAFQPLLLECL